MDKPLAFSSAERCTALAARDPEPRRLDGSELHFRQGYGLFEGRLASDSPRSASRLPAHFRQGYGFTAARLSFRAQHRRFPIVSALRHGHSSSPGGAGPPIAGDDARVSGNAQQRTKRATSIGYALWVKYQVRMVRGSAASAKPLNTSPAGGPRIWAGIPSRGLS